MAFEIERKFLVDSGWRDGVEHSRNIRQGYIVNSPRITLRVSINSEGGAMVTVKRPTDDPVVRHEWNDNIPYTDGLLLLAMECPKIIEKTRHYQGPWEIDEFFGDNEGLVVAEIELDSVEDAVPQPSWLGKEVTDDPNYLNASLVDYPYCDWSF